MGKRKTMTASQMGRKRWQGVSAEDRAELMRAASARRVASLTQEQRAEIGKRLAAARAAKRGARPDSV